MKRSANNERPEGAKVRAGQARSARGRRQAKATDGANVGREQAATGPERARLRLGQLDRALRFARARLNPDISAQRLLILLNVYFNEGMSQRELLDQLDSTSITALSRNLADLSAFTTRKTAGPGLLELQTDPMNLRIKRVHLTPKGRRLIRDWVAVIEEAPATRQAAGE